MDARKLAFNHSCAIYLLEACTELDVVVEAVLRIYKAMDLILS